jgi:hypothetical protein
LTARSAWSLTWSFASIAFLISSFIVAAKLIELTLYRRQRKNNFMISERQINETAKYSLLKTGNAEKESPLSEGTKGMTLWRKRQLSG